jgi:phosphocarrier protein|tara:strand:- start:583 stop:861 length:279 start_codon:yes stop_codon:yes gene_type:complete
VTEDVKEITLTIHNQKGLHARAAAKFVNVTSKFESEIKVSKENENVSGKSIMGLLMLTAVKGTTIRITANGSDASQVLEKLTRLIDNKFDEE